MRNAGPERSRTIERRAARTPRSRGRQHQGAGARGTGNPPLELEQCTSGLVKTRSTATRQRRRRPGRTDRNQPAPSGRSRRDYTLRLAPTEIAAAGASRHDTGRQGCGEAAPARATAPAASPRGDGCLPVRAVEPAWQVREDHTPVEGTGFSDRKANTEGCRQPGDELQRGVRPRRSRRQRAARYRARKPALRHVPAADDLADTYAKREPASREDGTTSRTSRTATTVTASPQSVQRRHAGHSVKVGTDDNHDAKTNRRLERTSPSRGRARRQAGSRRRQRDARREIARAKVARRNARAAAQKTASGQTRRRPRRRLRHAVQEQGRRTTKTTATDGGWHAVSSGRGPSPPATTKGARRCRSRPS